jgi:hypothetical protein
LVMAVVQMRPTATENNTVGASFATGSSSEKLELKPLANGFQLEYATKGEKTIVIRSADGAVLEEKTIRGGTFSSPLSNPNPNAKLLEITVEGEAPVFLAIPGTRMQAAESGMGSLPDFALAVAGYYRQPVMFSQNEDAKLSWTLAPGQATEGLEKTLADTKYTVKQNQHGVIVIHPN